MKIQEFRELIKAADRELLEKAFAESYKKFTKGQKEEVDLIIQGVLAGEDARSVAKKDTISFEKLEQEIPVFLENAYAQNYFAPNRVIPKNQRPKWRFLVKNYIKALEKIPAEDENCDKSARLLSDLYRMLCTACNYYLFSTDDAFRSVGWEQPELFRLVVKKWFCNGYSREKIAILLNDAVSGGLSREALHIFQISVLLDELKTSDVKYMAIEEAGKLIDERKKKLGGLKKYDSTYQLDDEINCLCEMVLMTAIELAEPASGIEFFFQNSRHRNEEITLFCALQTVEWMEADELWTTVYEYGIGKKIEPRDSLAQKYQAMKHMK